MAINQKKLSGGGEVGAVTPQQSKIEQFISRFKLFCMSKKITLFVGASLLFLGVLTIVYVLFNHNRATIMPVDNQQVDQEALNKALENLQKDPSSIPSGVFLHDKEANFQTQANNDANQGTTQQ